MGKQDVEYLKSQRWDIYLISYWVGVASRGINCLEFLALYKGWTSFLDFRKDLKAEKSTFESVLMRWMKLEPIIQSEVSQKEKHQYSILTHIYGI